MGEDLTSGGQAAPRLRLRVAAAAEAALRAGHPWVYSDSLREQNRAGSPGELAVVYDRKDRFLAAGLFDPDSPIRFRALQVGRPATIDRDWWAARLVRAVERRQGLFDGQTTGYRLINGESDGWPGLVLDRYGTTLALKIYTAAWCPWLEEVAGLIQAQFKPERIVLRSSRNLQRGIVSAMETRSERRNLSHAGKDAPSAREGRGEGGRCLSVELIRLSVQEGQILHGPPLDGPVVFLETGLQFEADVLRGQKTGFFLDQRENRRRVEALAGGRRALNAFSFTGGFSLYAARGGAVSVTDLDLSAHALAGAQRNFALNESVRAGPCPHESVQADAFEWLAGNPRRKFDLIILDPPSFAKRESERAAAIRAYEKLAGLGIGHLARHGFLVACSCSAHVAAEEFRAAVRRAAAKAGRKFEELQTTGHAPDHPASFKEAEYLKAIFMNFT